MWPTRMMWSRTAPRIIQMNAVCAMEMVRRAYVETPVFTMVMEIVMIVGSTLNLVSAVMAQIVRIVEYDPQEH